MEKTHTKEDQKFIADALSLFKNSYGLDVESICNDNSIDSKQQKSKVIAGLKEGLAKKFNKPWSELSQITYGKADVDIDTYVPLFYVTIEQANNLKNLKGSDIATAVYSYRTLFTVLKQDESNPALEASMLASGGIVAIGTTMLAGVVAAYSSLGAAATLVGALSLFFAAPASIIILTVMVASLLAAFLMWAMNLNREICGIFVNNTPYAFSLKGIDNVYDGVYMAQGSLTDFMTSDPTNKNALAMTSAFNLTPNSPSPLNAVVPCGFFLAQKNFGFYGACGFFALYNNELNHCLAIMFANPPKDDSGVFCDFWIPEDLTMSIQELYNEMYSHRCTSNSWNEEKLSAEITLKMSLGIDAPTGSVASAIYVLEVLNN
jgi:hypothetical protein